MWDAKPAPLPKGDTLTVTKGVQAMKDEEQTAPQKETAQTNEEDVKADLTKEINGQFVRLNMNKAQQIAVIGEIAHAGGLTECGVDQLVALKEHLEARGQ